MGTTDSPTKPVRKLNWLRFRKEIKLKYYAPPEDTSMSVVEKFLYVFQKCAERHLGEDIPVVFLFHAYEGLYGRQVPCAGSEVKEFRKKLTRHKDALLAIGLAFESFLGVKKEPCIRIVGQGWSAYALKLQHDRRLKNSIDRVKKIDALVKSLPAASAPKSLSPEDIQAAQKYHEDSRKEHNKYNPPEVPLLPSLNAARARNRREAANPTV